MWFRKSKPWHLDTDVVVVGTGAAGATAALAAHAGKARVVVLDKSEKFGGTTAVSGGVVWVPNNRHMAEVGIEDSFDAALAYVTRLADGRSDPAMIRRYLAAAPEMIEFVEGATPVAFKALARYPDYHPEFEGGRPGGRSLDPGLFDTNQLGAWKDKLRRSPVFGMTAMSVSEATDWGVFSKPSALPFGVLAKRFKQGLVCYGGALAGGLLKALLDRGLEPKLGTAVHELIVEDDRVAGVRAEHDGKELLIRARRGVVLASGGFEWNAELVGRFLGGPLTHPNSPPGNDGDGLRMAMALGADLGNMSEAWWCPSLVIPGEDYDGRQLHRGDFATRSLPHTIIVNRAGQRFVNEAHNYNDMMKAFFAFDPVSYQRPNLPAWIVLDAQYLARYALLTYVPGMPVPEWLVKADTLDELAAAIGVDARGLAATVARFNRFAVEGADPDFHRGESLYDHFYGDPEHGQNPNLGTIEQGPFYAIQVHPGAIGTKGGPRIDGDARVLRVGGEAIPGLYAAGNVAAGVTGAGYPGAGATIGAAMTFGYLAGRHAAAQPGAK
ncbi:MAG: FAD-dependent oxidoreductase [Kofleriaceae bacterium]|nr:FAD-dependent oxidoreductase [Myxococcales bacterium]MCB9561282.1 FAD-dependent oxidoreductase [Kofleriaceae bacterium]